MTDLNELLDMDFAPSWYPQEGDKLIGVVVDVDERDAGYGPYPIYTIRITHTPTPVRLKEGTAKIGDVVAWHARSTVAKNEAAALQRGYETGVKREMDKPNPKGGDKPMSVWKVKYNATDAPSAPAADVVDDGPSADELI